LIIIVDFKTFALINRLLIYFVFGFASLPVWAQHHSPDLRKQYDNLYGFDLTIFQGKAYQTEINIESGFPFWMQESFFTGSLVVDGVRHDSLLLKYDIYKHNAILGFKDLNGALNQLIIDPSTVDSIFMNGTVFIPSPHPKLKGDFVEFVHKGTVSCYVYWEKQKQVNTNSNSKGYFFSKQKSRRCFVYQGELYFYSSLSKLCNLFDKQKSAQIKLFAKKNGIKFRRCSNSQLSQLLDFVDQINLDR
jgi:hypothetical protein